MTDSDVSTGAPGAPEPISAVRAVDGPAVADRVGLPRIVMAVAVVNGFTRLAWVASATILLPIQIIAAVGETNKETWIGIITKVGAMAGIIFSPLLGRWSDRTRSRLGRRAPWMLFGAAGAVFAYALVGLVTNSITLLFAWSLQQVALMAITVATNTVLPERIPMQKRGLATGISALVAVAAALTGSFLGAAFITNVAAGMFLMGALTLIGTISFVLLAPMHSTKDLPRVPRSEKGFSIPEFFSALKSHNYRWMWIGVASMTLAYQFLLSRIVYFCQAWFGLDVQAAAETTATTIAIGGLAMMLPMVLIGPISDKFGRRPFMYAGGVIQAGGLIFVLSTHEVGTFLIAYAVLSLGAGLFMGAQLPLAADVLPDGGQDIGQDLGVYQLSSQLPQMLAPAIGSLILAMTGNYGAMLIVGVIASLFAVFAITRIKGVK